MEGRLRRSFTVAYRRKYIELVVERTVGDHRSNIRRTVARTALASSPSLRTDMRRAGLSVRACRSLVTEWRQPGRHSISKGALGYGGRTSSNGPRTGGEHDTRTDRNLAVRLCARSDRAAR